MIQLLILYVKKVTLSIVDTVSTNDELDDPAWIILFWLGFGNYAAHFTLDKENILWKNEENNFILTDRSNDEVLSFC